MPERTAGAGRVDAAAGTAVATPPVGPERLAAITELGIAFRSAFRSLRSLRGRDTHRGDEIGHAQYELLAELCAHGPLQAGELAEAVEASAATVSGMLDHLSEADLVERTRSDTDRRIVVVKVTRRGKRKVEARKALWQARWQGALEGLDDDELQTAARVLERIHGIFCEQQRES
ncbi:MAG TPA: MarR family transcriptional regulator [Solirubrobacterales bacterium]|nr:MarR family transcriptional regulator [Solirubrobacterales bacterium]